MAVKPVAGKPVVGPITDAKTPSIPTVQPVTAAQTPTLSGKTRAARKARTQNLGKGKLVSTAPVVRPNPGTIARPTPIKPKTEKASTDPWKTGW